MKNREEQKYTQLPNGQFVRDSSGNSLEHIATPALLRAYRSKYFPHVGAKQQARAERQHA